MRLEKNLRCQRRPVENPALSTLANSFVKKVQQHTGKLWLVFALLNLLAAPFARTGSVSSLRSARLEWEG